MCKRLEEDVVLSGTKVPMSVFQKGVQVIGDGDRLEVMCVQWRLCGRVCAVCLCERVRVCVCVVGRTVSVTDIESRL